MDAYGNYLSGWYDKFFEEQNELLVKLAKGSTLDFLTGKPTSADLFKNVPTKMDSIMAMPSQHELMENLLGNYKWPSLPPSITGNVAGRAVEEMSGSVQAALNPEIQKLNRELMGMSSAHPAIKGIVDRAVELSTMQRQADTETAPEDEEVPNAVEEFVENNPEEADDIADGTQEAVRKSIKAPKDKWDSLPSESKIEIIMDAYRTASSSFFTAINSPIGIASVAEIANNIVLFLVTFVVLVHQAKNDVEESD